MSEIYPDLTGFVFYYQTSYYKVTGPARSGLGMYSYPVVKCSKHGKEYRDTNGIAVSYVKRAWEEAGCPAINNTVGLKADIDAGIDDGVRKRRIQHLRDRIASAERELAELGVQ